MNKIKVGVIGCGYWGANLIRNFSMCPFTDLVAVCDKSAENLAKSVALNNSIKAHSRLQSLIDLGLDAVAIATPVNTHYEIARDCLNADLHVLVEKPLANSSRKCEKLLNLADEKKRILMVDHTYIYNESIRKIKELIVNDELGDILYIDGVRINLGLFQEDVNVIWDLATHDLAIVDFLFSTPAKSLSAWGGIHTTASRENIAYINLDFNNNMIASFHINWLSPVKIRQMIIAGSKKSLVYNELNVSEPIKIYDRGITLTPKRSLNQNQVNYRTGDIHSPHIKTTEALQNMVTHFAMCILDGTPCESDGMKGLQIVRYLEAADRSLNNHNSRITLNHSPKEKHRQCNGNTSKSGILSNHT